MATPLPSSLALSNALEAIYDVVRGVSARSREEAAAQLPALEVRLADHRDLTRRIRDILRAAEDEQQLLEEAVAKLRAVADPEAADIAELAVLRGRRLARVAVEVLAESGRAQPIHYKEWFELLRDAGHRVGGVDAIATFLTSLSRSEQVESVGARTGLYRIHEDVAA